MARPPACEEKYPLLLLYVEDSNGKRSEFPQRVVFADKGRGNHLTQGAAAIISQWPGQVTSCWLTSLALGSGFIFLVLLLLMSSLSPMMHPAHPRCTRDVAGYSGNRTIHLVKDGSDWNRAQLDILKFVADSYPDFEIHNILVETSMNKFKKPEKKIERRTERSVPTVDPFPDFGTIFINRINEILHKRNEISNEESIRKNNLHASNLTFLRRIKRNEQSEDEFDTYEDILSAYPNIKEHKTTYRKFFMHTPLQYFWTDLNPEMLMFAIRVQELWQNGGITFHLPFSPPETNSSQTVSNSIEKTENGTTFAVYHPENLVENDNYNNSTRLKMLITNTRSRFEEIPEDQVSVDGQALHMATKMPCHTFFGEMLIKLQRDYGNISVPEFIQMMLNTFCRRGAVDSDYCKKLRK